LRVEIAREPGIISPEVSQQSDEATSRAQACSVPDADPILYTIGYGARTLDGFLTTLAAHRIEYLLDVRSAPYSKFKPEFSKDALEAALRTKNIGYGFLGDTLGGQPRDPECFTDGKVDYAKVRRQEFFRTGLERVRTTYEQGVRTVLMCSEGHPENCHRSKMIGEALAEVGIAVRHIDEQGRLLSQVQVMDRLTGGQLDLFGGPTLTSRKRYAPDEKGSPNGGL